MSGPMSLREARTKQQKEKSYKNSRLRFRASMKPTRNERSPSEHGDEKSTRRKKIMKVDNTEGEGSDPAVGGSGTEEMKIAVGSAGDVEMSGGSGEVVAKESTSADLDVKDTGDTESDNMSIEKALEIVCGGAEPEDKLPATEDEGSEDSLMPEDGNKVETSTSADETIVKKKMDEGEEPGESSEKISKQEEGAGSDMPLFKDEEGEKKDKTDKKKKRSGKDDDDSDEDDNEDGKKIEKGKKKDKDGDGSGGIDKPEGGDGNDKDDDASGGDKSAGGEGKDGEDKDGGDNQKGGTDGQNSDDDFDMGGNGEGDKNVSDDDLDDLGGSSEDGATDNEGSDIEETEISVAGETELEITDDEESDADNAAGKGIGELNIAEEGIGGIVFDRGEGGGGNRDQQQPTTKNTNNEETEKVNDFDIAIAIDPYDVESDIDYEDEASAEEDYCEYLSGGSGCEDDNSYYGDDDYLEDVEEVRGTG